MEGPQGQDPDGAADHGEGRRRAHRHSNRRTTSPSIATGPAWCATMATGCRDETAARQVLADLERRAELVRSGVMTAAEAAVGDHQAAPLAEHFDAF